MPNHEITKRFLGATDSKTKTLIIEQIASHYGITSAAALEEITGVEAESLLDYLTGPIRSATHVLMKRHGLA